MARDGIMSERYLVVARVTQRQLPAFPAKGWVVVEVFGDEVAGRERFHQLRLPLERLKLGAVLIRAMTTAGFERIAYEKTVISKDAEFWDLHHAELIRASQAQQEAWNTAIDGALAAIAEERDAAARKTVEAKAARNHARSGRNQRQVALAAGFFAVLGAAGVTAILQHLGEPAPAVVARAGKDTMTIIIADPADPRMLTEYALKPDGTRTAVRRLTREQVAAGVASADPETTATSPARGAPKTSLVDALNGFFAVRE